MEGDARIPWSELTLGERIGSGGQATVFRGTRRGRDGDLALKRLDGALPVEPAAQAAALAKALKELRRHVVAASRCERVCRIVGASLDEAEGIGGTGRRRLAFLPDLPSPNIYYSTIV